MKRLDIKGFYSMSTKMVSDRFRIDGMDTLTELYVIKLNTSTNQYRIDIIREATEVKCKGLNYRYQLWIYDWNTQTSYPMGVTTQDLVSLDNFTQFLENVLDIADRGGFDGEAGDWRFKKYNL
jgi:hypothetical protein